MTTDEQDLGEPRADAAEAQLETAADEPDERDARYLRLAADFENFKRRKTQELADVRRYESEDAALARCSPCSTTSAVPSSTPAMRAPRSSS
jgi:molecular chaperone GrpE (heat shock protein)